MKTLGVYLILCASLVFAGSDPTRPILPPELRDIGIQQRLGAQVPLDATFEDESGATVRFGGIATQRPAVLAFVYYTCPMLCNQILTGLVSGLRPLSLVPGRDFDVIAVSINPAETPQDATGKRDFYVRRYSRSANPAGWHFLTGTEPEIRKVANAAGFHYRYDPQTRMFVHASGVMVLTPDRKVARYLYGVEYQPKDLKLGLVEASGHKIGSPADEILLFCYHYDPSTGKYTLKVVKLLRAAALLILFVIGGGLIVLWRRDIQADRHAERELTAR